MTYDSTISTASKAAPGVRLTIRRMSFGRRLDLTRQVKHLLGRFAFLSAGDKTPVDETEAALLAGEIDRVYVRWGLAAVEGLEIDGKPATAEQLVENGPEDLVAEVLALVRKEAGLSEEELKNSASHSTSTTETRPAGNATNAEKRAWRPSEDAAGFPEQTMMQPASCG